MMKLNQIAALMLSSSTVFSVVAEQFTFPQIAPQSAKTVVLFAEQDGKVFDLELLPAETQKHLLKAIDANHFTSEQGQLVELLAPNGLSAERIVIMGLGKAPLTKGAISDLGGTLATHLAKQPSQQVNVYSKQMPDGDAFAAAFAHGVELKSYRYNAYKDQGHLSKDYALITTNAAEAAKAHQALQAIEAGIFLARDMTNAPPGDMYPEAFAKQALSLRADGVTVKVLEGKALEKLNMGALIGVGQGSERKPRLVVAHWKGSDEAPIALVGKGITFDSGGYNIKASGGSIVHMKSDMAGAAAVLGTVKAMAMQKAPVNVVAIMPLAENMVSEFALRPGDVVKTAAGKTVEVTNTDAEGRLILADGLWYAQEKFKPKMIVDVATLTGAKVRALGREFTGLFSDESTMVESLSYAGQQVGEPLWRLPLSAAYGEQLQQSNIADLRNTGTSAGASVAAMFLKEFVTDTPWAHLDIAGNALSHEGTAVSPAGATGHGVRLLSYWLSDAELQKQHAGL